MIVTITGLPRSGTAFLGSALSQLLTDEDGTTAISYHELASYGPKWAKTLESQAHRYYYLINSATYNHHPEFMMKIPGVDNKYIKIMQHPELSFLKTVNALGAGPITAQKMRQAIHRSHKLLEDFNPEPCLTLQRAEVFTEDGLHKAYRFLSYHSNGLYWDDDKAREILKLNVTHKLENLMKNFNEEIYK